MHEAPSSNPSTTKIKKKKKTKNTDGALALDYWLHEIVKRNKKFLQTS
jgi:hypothetical protein